MNAIDLLITEHNRVRQLLNNVELEEQYEKKQTIFYLLSEDLIRHENMEHTIWYPYFKDNNKLDETVRHLISEEKHAEKAIKSLRQTNDQAEWNNKFSQFKKEVEHHATEEESKLFPKIKALLDEKELNNIGKKMLDFKRECESISL